MQQSQFLVQNPPQAPILKEGNKNDDGKQNSKKGKIDIILTCGNVIYGINILDHI